MVNDQDLIAPLKKLAKASQAKLARVACFVIKNGAVVSSGINYNPTGAPMEDLVDGEWVSRPEVVHAEVAAIQAATANHIELEGTRLLLTMSPCITCAHEIVSAGIRDVSYLYEWWDKASLDILHDGGVTTQKLKEER